MTTKQQYSANNIQIRRATVLFLVVLLSLGSIQQQDGFFVAVESFVPKLGALRFTRRMPSTGAEAVLSPLLLSPPSLGPQQQRQSTITPPRHSYLSASSLTTAPPTAPPERQNQDASVTNNVKEKQQQREEEDVMMVARLPAIVIKERLMGLLGSMKGTESQFRLVETYVNALEGRHQPAQTLGFFNLQVQGSWQLLFSTALTKHLQSPNKFRLRSVTQQVSPATTSRQQQQQQRPRNDNDEGEVGEDASNNNQPPGGSITNRVVWDLADRIEGRFDVSGTFDCVCSYKMVQGGARMMLTLEDHVLELSKGSKVPSDVQGLVGRLHRTMPKELFDPTDHAVDTTYVDADIRIVRHTGPRLEGVRDIFVRETSTTSSAAGTGETE